MTHATGQGIRFVTYGAVVGQGSMVALISKSTGKAIVKQGTRLIAWRDTVGYGARRAMRGRPKLEGPLELCVWFYLPRRKSVTRDRPSVKPDLDKLVRAIGDAMEGIVYANDSQIVRVLAEKFYGKRSRVEISVSELGLRLCAAEGAATR